MKSVNFSAVTVMVSKVTAEDESRPWSSWAQTLVFKQNGDPEVIIHRQMINKHIFFILFRIIFNTFNPIVSPVISQVLLYTDFQFVFITLPSHLGNDI